MKKTDLEKFKAKKLDIRLAQEQSTQRGAAAQAAHQKRAVAPGNSLVGKLLQQVLGKK
jgi:hypothetical protein